LCKTKEEQEKSDKAKEEALKNNAEKPIGNKPSPPPVISKPN
jgi:hypothetical protein